MSEATEGVTVGIGVSGGGVVAATAAASASSSVGVALSPEFLCITVIIMTMVIRLTAAVTIS